MAPSFTPCDINLNCFSAPNNSLVVSSDVSNSGSLLRNGKVVATQWRRIVRTLSDFVISNKLVGASVKCPSKANTLEGLPRKRRVIS